MDPEQLWDTTMNPDVRKLIRVDINDAKGAALLFEILMGGDVPPRKEFIMANAKYADLDL